MLGPGTTSAARCLGDLSFSRCRPQVNLESPKCRVNDQLLTDLEPAGYVVSCRQTGNCAVIVANFTVHPRRMGPWTCRATHAAGVTSASQHRSTSASKGLRIGASGICGIFQSWDTAVKATELSDFSACTTWGKKDKNLYLLHGFAAANGIMRSAPCAWAPSHTLHAMPPRITRNSHRPRASDRTMVDLEYQFGLPLCRTRWHRHHPRRKLMSMGNRPSFSREAQLQWAGSRETNLASGRGRTFFLTSLFIELIEPGLSFRAEERPPK